MVAVTKFQTDYELQGITISVASAGNFDVKPYMVELNLYEDIFGDSVSGTLLISDAIGLLPNFRMNGTEFITIMLRKNSQDTSGQNINRTFRIYKVSDRYFVPGNNFENYTINFCSEELLLSEKYRISKAYKNKTISEMVKDIFANHLKVGDKKKVFVESTTGTFDFVLPNKKLFETINWLSTYATTGKTGSDVLFFENTDGFWFKSLQSLYSQSPYLTYYYNPKNVSSEMQQKYTNIISMDVLDSFDMLRSTSSGTFSNRLISVDPLTRKFTTTDFDYNEYCKKSTKMNKYPVTNNYKDRVGKKTFEAPPNNLQAGAFRLLPTNSGQRNFSFIKNRPTSVFSDYSVEKTIPYRAAQLSLANFSRLKITVPGNAKMSVGMTINIVVPSMGPTSYAKVDNPTKRENDPYLSGKYLITAARHMINLDTYVTVLEICKESNEGQITGVPETWSTLSQG